MYRLKNNLRVFLTLISIQWQYVPPCFRNKSHIWRSLTFLLSPPFYLLFLISLIFSRPHSFKLFCSLLFFRYLSNFLHDNLSLFFDNPVCPFSLFVPFFNFLSSSSLQTIDFLLYFSFFNFFLFLFSLFCDLTDLVLKVEGIQLKLVNQLEKFTHNRVERQVCFCGAIFSHSNDRCLPLDLRLLMFGLLLLNHSMVGGA